MCIPILGLFLKHPCVVGRTDFLIAQSIFMDIDQAGEYTMRLGCKLSFSLCLLTFCQILPIGEASGIVEDRRKKRRVALVGFLFVPVSTQTLCFTSSEAVDFDFQLLQKHSQIQPHYPSQLLLLSHFGCVRLCATPQKAAHQAPPSLGFSRQEHWSGLPFPSPLLGSEK